MKRLVPPLFALLVLAVYADPLICARTFVGLFSTLYAGSLPVLALFGKRRPAERGCRFARVLLLAGLAACVLPSLIPRSWQAFPSPVALRYPEKIAVLCVLALAISRADPEGRYRTLGESIYSPSSPLRDLCQRTDPTYTDYARRSCTQHTHSFWRRGSVFNYDFDAGDLSRVESLRRTARNLVDSGNPGYLFASLALRFGVRFRDQPPLAGYRRIGGDALQDWDENPDAAPAIRLLPAWRQEPDGLAALKDLGRLSAGEAVLETGSSGSGGARLGRIVTREDTPERLRVETESLDSGWLFVLRSFWTHRSVEVDGRAVEPVPAQLAFTAVPVPAGRHSIEWEERLPGASVSRWGPVLFGLFAAGLLLSGRERGGS